ncbi:MAG: hypothetical protein WCI03_09225 [bacterium]
MLSPFLQRGIKLKQTSENHPILITVSFLVMVSLVLPTLFPVYFREDDVVYLQWARLHPWQDCFRPSQAVLFGMFRPVQNLTWWGLYHLAGLNPYPYQVAILFSYLAALATFFAFIKTALSTRVAFASMAAYGVAFYFLTYIVFWFSDLTYTLELLFAHGALWCFALAIKFNSRRHLAGAIALFCMAVAAKEPAALLVPLICSQLLAVKWKQLNQHTRRYLAISAALMLTGGVLWLLMNPAVQSRQGIPLRQGFDLCSAFIMQRWSFYASCLTAFPTILVWVAVLFLAIQRVLFRSTHDTLNTLVISMGISIAGALFLKMAPNFALLFLISAFPLLILSRHPAGIGAIWAAPALLGILTLEFIVRTYLVETSFGLALICGTAATPLMDRLALLATSRSAQHRKRILMLSATALLALGIGMHSLLSAKLQALKILSANRQNFADAISFLAHPNEKALAPLIIVDYADMGIVYERDILPLGDGEKALRQKTMTSLSLAAFLPSIPIHNLEWWNAHPEVMNASLLTLNVREEEFLNGMALRKSLLREWTRQGTRVRLYHITRERAALSPFESTGTSAR